MGIPATPRGRCRRQLAAVAEETRIDGEADGMVWNRDEVGVNSRPIELRSADVDAIATEEVEEGRVRGESTALDRCGGGDEIGIGVASVEVGAADGAHSAVECRPVDELRVDSDAVPPVDALMKLLLTLTPLIFARPMLV